MSSQILPPRWTMQPFEKALANLEVERLVGMLPEREGEILSIPSTLPWATIERLIRRVSFARAIAGPDGEIPTVEYETERAAGGGRRKVTSHALHGIHPYKGKFYPQLARSLLNICEVPDNGLVVDPFAGCGTSVLEAGLLGIRGIGVDANPMAVMVSQAKLDLLSYPVATLWKDLQPLLDLPANAPLLAHDDYLARWFPPENLNYLRRAVNGISALTSPIARNGAIVALSSVLRDASFQDPRQLRIGRRSPSTLIPSLASLFQDALQSLKDELAAVQNVPGLEWESLGKLQCRVIEGDARNVKDLVAAHDQRRADAIITSPPYASALPYVDTDRLSLYAFDLLPNGGQRAAEERQIGNREITTKTRIMLENEFASALRDAPWVPQSLHDVIVATTAVARESTSGFRKQRTPALLFAYFRDMRAVFTQMARLVRPGGPVAVVIADNVVAGPNGTKIPVPTSDILAAIAEGVGLRLESDFSKRLTSYGASETIHQRNAMDGERVLIFKSSPTGR